MMLFLNAAKVKFIKEVRCQTTRCNKHKVSSTIKSSFTTHRSNKTPLFPPTALNPFSPFARNHCPPGIPLSAWGLQHLHLIGPPLRR